MPKPKQPPCPTEYEEQCRVITWARNYAILHNVPELNLLHGDSSGVRVPIGCAVKMKKAGAIKGWPDLFLAVPMNVEDISGLFIELKRQRGGVVSQEQSTIHELLRKQGYRVEVCKGSDEAIAVIKNYLGLE